MAPPFFCRRIRSGNQSLTRTSRNSNGERVASVGSRAEAADPTLPSGALNLALAFFSCLAGIWLLAATAPSRSRLESGSFSATFWLVWLRGLSVLRFAGRSPLRDSSRTEEAGIRFFGGERLPRAAHPVPRDRRGGVGAQADPALAFGALIFRRKPLAGMRPPGEQRETVPGSCRAGPVDDLTDRSFSLYGACQVELGNRVFDVG